MKLAEIPGSRLRLQRLTGPPFKTAEEVVDWLVAVQSQDFGGAKWGVAQRTSGATQADLDRLFDEGKILRTHVLRPTWHFVRPADLRWLQRLTGPRVKAMSAYYFRKLELTDAVIKRSQTLITRALRDGRYLTREEVGDILKKGGITASGLRLAYIVMVAELDALVCSGPLRGKQFTYALVDERAPETRPRKFDRDEALAELTRRFFESRGPALLHDFAGWSGLTVTDAKAGVAMLGKRLEKVELDGRAYWFAPPLPRASNEASPRIQLLPNYDEYVSSYKDATASFDPEVLAQLKPESVALMGNILTLDGRIIGGWSRTLKKHEAGIELKLLTKLKRREKAAVLTALSEYGAFLGVKAQLLNI